MKLLEFCKFIFNPMSEHASPEERRGPTNDPCTGRTSLDRHARFMTEVIHREAVQTRLILESILAQIMRPEVPSDDKQCLDAVLVKAKSLAKRIRRLAASMARLDNETPP